MQFCSRFLERLCPFWYFITFSFECHLWISLTHHKDPWAGGIRTCALQRCHLIKLLQTSPFMCASFVNVNIIKHKKKPPICLVSWLTVNSYRTVSVHYVKTHRLCLILSGEGGFGRMLLILLEMKETVVQSSSIFFEWINHNPLIRQMLHPIQIPIYK